VEAQKLLNGASDKGSNGIDAQNVGFFLFGQINQFKSLIVLFGLKSGY
jgi:hypothetical protein